MTDFLHEQPAPDKPEQQAPAETPEKMTERQRTRRVFLYAVIFFATAFLLILWSFLMANRSSQDILSELKQSTSKLQSSLEETGDMATLISSLESDLQEAQTEAADAKARADELENAVLAMDWLREIEHAYAAKDFETAKKLLLAFDAHALAQYLPEESLHTSDRSAAPSPSPAETFRAIHEELLPAEKP